MSTRKSRKGTEQFSRALDSVIRIYVISDMHCGHRNGITSTRYQKAVASDASRVEKKSLTFQQESFNWLMEAFRLEGPADYLLVNGDCIEGKGVRSGGTELLTTDRKIQSEMAVDVIKKLQALAKIKETYMTYGTPSHCGTEEDWEDWIADKVGAAKIEAEGHYCFNGVQIAMKHKIGNSASPVSAKTALSSAQIRQMLWSDYHLQPRANIIIRSHIHRCYYVGEPGSNFQGWVTPGLQGLGSKFGARECDGLPVAFGFLVIDIVDINRWFIRAVLAPGEMQKCDVIQVTKTKGRLITE